MNAAHAAAATADPLDPAGGETVAALRHRLRAAARLLDLLAEQVEAKRDGDPGRQRWLMQERQLLQHEVAGVADDPAGGGEVVEDVALSVGRLLEEASVVLEDRSEEEQRAHDFVEALQDASLPLLRELVRRSGAGGGYGLAGSEDRRINVRF